MQKKISVNLRVSVVHLKTNRCNLSKHLVLFNVGIKMLATFLWH